MTVALFVLLAVLLCIAASAACLQLGHLDSRLGDDMLTDPRHSLRAQVREWLGITGIYEYFHETERTMAKVIDLLNSLVAQQQDASAAQATSFHNIDAAFAKLQDAINNGDASPEVQAAASELAAGFGTLQRAAEDEGRIYQPADNNGGDTPPADGGDVPVEAPVDDTNPPVAAKARR